MTKEIQQYKERHGFEVFDPKAVLFDMDGVLYDSMPNHAKAWHETMAEYGIDMSALDAYRYEGMRGVETIKRVTLKQWGKAVSDKEAEDMYRVKSEHYSACGNAPLIPNVHELQQQLHQHGLKIGIVTGSGQQSLLNRILTDFDGLVCPDIMVCAKDVKQGKPMPDPYLMGMHKATQVLLREGLTLPYNELQPWQTMVVENAPLGVMAAHAARCFTVAVNTGPLPDEMLHEAGADIVLPNMRELTNWYTAWAEDRS